AGPPRREALRPPPGRGVGDRPAPARGRERRPAPEPSGDGLEPAQDPGRRGGSGHLRLDRAQPAPPVREPDRPPALTLHPPPASALTEENPMPDRFPSPFEMVAPTGAEGWEELYGYSTVFSDDRRELEDSMFWFMDGVHTPEVIEPWDATVLDFAITVLS